MITTAAPQHQIASSFITRLTKNLGKLFLAGLLSASLTNVYAQDNTLTPEESDAGFQLLFDGRSLSGWRTFGESDNVVFSAWSVENGTLRLTPKGLNKYLWIALARNRIRGGGSLATNERDYKNFHLKVDWKLFDQEGNSGLYMLVDEEAYLRKNGPLNPYSHGGMTSQIVDDAAILSGELDEEWLTGDLERFAAVPTSIVKPLNPVGQWNTQEVKVEQSRYVTVILNGTVLLNRVDLNTNGDFKGQLQLEDGSSILLQDHGNNVAYKNLKIKRCTDDARC